MAIQPAVLVPFAAVTNTPATIYTTPAGVTAIVKRAVFTNISDTPTLIGIAIQRSGQAAREIVSNRPVAAREAYIAHELSGLVLAPGDVLRASSGVVGLNGFVSGFTL